MWRKLVTIMGVTALAAWVSISWAGEAADGKATFQKLCASCHGPDGRGNPAMTKVFGEKLNITTKEVAKASDDELLKVITQGKGKMPASGKSLSKQEQKQVLEHVRSLAK